MRVRLSAADHARIEAEARAAYPRECCGLLEGTRCGDEIVIAALHPTPNLAGAPDRFEIDPAAHLGLQRHLRGTGRAIVGCYHSHPGGRPEPSARDGGVDFLWLIAASEGGLGAHLRRDGAWHPASFA